MDNYQPSININNNIYGCCSNEPTPPTPPEEDRSSMMGYGFGSFEDVGEDFQLIMEVPVTINSMRNVRVLTAQVNWVAEGVECPCETAITSIDMPSSAGFAEFVMTRAAVAEAIPNEVEVLRAVSAAELLAPKVDVLTTVDDDELSAKEEVVYKLYARITEELMRSITPVMVMITEYPLT